MVYYIILYEIESYDLQYSLISDNYIYIGI